MARGAADHGVAESDMTEQLPHTSPVSHPLFVSLYTFDLSQPRQREPQESGEGGHRA